MAIANVTAGSLEISAENVLDAGVKVDRGINAPGDAILQWSEADTRFNLKADHTKETLCPLNVSSLYVNGAEVISTDGLIDAAAAIAGAGLAETSGVLSVNVDDSTLALSTDTLIVKSGGITATQMANNTITATQIANNILSGTQVADVGSTGGIDVVLKTTLTDGNTVAIFTVNSPFKLEVIDAWSIALSTGAGTWKLTDGTDDITNAVAVTATAGTINKAASIDTTKSTIAANGSISVVGDGALADVNVYIRCIRVA